MSLPVGKLVYMNTATNTGFDLLGLLNGTAYADEIAEITAADEAADAEAARVAAVTAAEQIDCRRCNNTGFIPQYKHIEGGKCFACQW